MRRTGAFLVVFVLLALIPAAAFAATRVLRAAVGGSGTIYITFRYSHGVATKITTFEFNNIPASCQGYPSTAVTNKFANHIRVSSTGRFHATEVTNGGRETFTVSGHFVSLHKAKGTLRVKGTVPGCSSADTGSVAFTATRS